MKPHLSQGTFIPYHHLWRSTVRTETHLNGLILRFDKGIRGKKRRDVSLRYLDFSEHIPLLIPWNGTCWVENTLGYACNDGHFHQPRQPTKDETPKQVTNRNHEEAYSFPGTSFLEHVKTPGSYKDVKRNQCQSRKQTIFMASLHHGHVLGTNVLQSPNSLLEEILERTSALAIFQSLDIPININYTKMMLNQQANKNVGKKPKQIMRKR